MINDVILKSHVLQFLNEILKSGSLCLHCIPMEGKPLDDSVKCDLKHLQCSSKITN